MPAGIIAFAVALIASLVLVVPVRQLALRAGMVDHPGPRKVHLTPMPLLGGLAIYCGVVLGMLASMSRSTWSQMVGLLAGATLLLVVGTLDDRGLLHHQIKLFVGMPMAALILLASGVRAQAISGAWPGQAGQFVDAALTVLWVVGITASFSIFDHMDGLCAGVAAIASMFFVVLASLSGQVLVSTLAAAVLGAAMGFLRWNFNPAKIFMGDGGAMFLGFLLAALGVKLRPLGMPDATRWMVPVLLLGIPIFDTTLVSISRSRRGLLPFATPGKDHAAHRLSNLRLGPRMAVLILYGAGLVFGLLAFAITQLPPQSGYLLGATTAVAGLLGVALFERAPYERQVKRKLIE